MNKLLLITVTAILFLSCSSDSELITETPQTKNYTLTFIDASFEKLNNEGYNLPVNENDPVTIFEHTTSITITQLTFETNTIAPIGYFENENVYSLPEQTQFIFYEESRIVIKKIEYHTDYGKDKRQERYSY